MIIYGHQLCTEYRKLSANGNESVRFVVRKYLSIAEENLLETPVRHSSLSDGLLIQVLVALGFSWKFPRTEFFQASKQLGGRFGPTN